MESLATSDRSFGTQPAPEIRIKRARPEHPGDAFALIEEYYDAIGVIARDDRASLLHYLSGSHSAIWVAYSGDASIGCIMYRVLPHLNASGEIKRLYVRPRYRGLGIARLLLHTLEQFAREHRIAWLYLDTKDDLTNAIAFYRRHGYQPCARYNDNPQATIFLRKRLSSDLLIRTFEPGDEEPFRKLNEAWIEKHFHIEDMDRETLNHPQSSILAPGGQIFMALRDGEAIGCCALLAIGNREWELVKMAVAEKERGQGVGRKLLEYVIDYARNHAIPRLYLETNSSLANAIHLYKSVGFREVPSERLHPSPYSRANVFLEMMLD